MKNKKSLLTICLLALVLVLGIGYAVVTAQDLTINGTASTIDGGKMDVAFTSVEENPTIVGTGVTATGSVTSDLVASLTVANLSKIGDSAEVTYVMTNRETDLAASITQGDVTVVSSTNANKELGDYYKVEVTIPEGVITKNGGTKNVKVKVSLVKLPIAVDESTANISVGFVATPVQPE